MLGEALSYAKLGWRVFPCKPKDKTPLTTHGFKDATTDLGKIVEWWEEWPSANIGIATGRDSNLVVVDFDPKKGGDAKAMRDKYIAKLRGLSWPIVETGTGGRHWYWAYPSGVALKTQQDLLPGVDVRADGGYVVAPPSVHPNGNIYRWVVPPVSVYSAQPDFFLDLQRAKELERERRRNSAGLTPGQRSASAEADVPEAKRVYRAAKYLQSIRGAVSGSGGHQQTFSVAVALTRGFALPEPVALELLRSEYNPRCRPPWSDSELVHKIRGASQTSVPMGYLL